jgi:hypothetical protein
VKRAHPFGGATSRLRDRVRKNIAIDSKWSDYRLQIPASGATAILEKVHIRAMLLPNGTCRVRAWDDAARRGKAEEASMNRQAETQGGHALSRGLTLPYCPQCNDLVFAPLASEFVSASHVRHQWSCEACGHAFLTSVQLQFSLAPRTLS